METVLRSIVTLSVTMNCSYDIAIDYLSKPMNQKEWGTHFYQDIEEIDGIFMATLPFGKMPLQIKSDFETGTIDIYLGDGKPIRTRLIEIEDNLCIYNFTLAQPQGMPDEVWKEKALPDMEDELNNLKSILENK